MVRLFAELVELAIRALVFVAEMLALAVVAAYRYLTDLVHGFRAEGNPKANEDTSKMIAGAILAVLIGLLVLVGSLLSGGSGGSGDEPPVRTADVADVPRGTPDAPTSSEEAVYREAKQAADGGHYGRAREIIDESNLTDDGPDRVARRLARHVRSQANSYVRTFSHGERARRLARGANTIRSTEQGRRLLAETRRIPVARNSPPRPSAHVPAAPPVPSAPAPDLGGGSTGVCNDGTVSPSVGKPGACSGHGGVAG